jgi:hypothetical protein
MHAMKNTTRRILYATLIIPAAWAAACRGNDAIAPLPDGIEALRASLTPFVSLSVARDAGYDVALTGCMSNGDEGAMGVHYGNPTLIDGTADPRRPEVLIYEPTSDGGAALVGVEFVIPFAVLPKTASAPVLFGQPFVPNDDFGLWTLHVWTQRANPSGLFAPWNPRVHC